MTKAVKTRKGAEVTVKNEGFEDFASAVVPEMEDHGMQIAALREELAAMKANQKKNQGGRCLISWAILLLIRLLPGRIDHGVGMASQLH